MESSGRSEEAEQAGFDELRRLYEAAIAFAKLAPWHWMENDELFGVKDPASGKVGYVCVMGALGEVMGAAVYPGDRGYECYRRVITGALVGGESDAWLSQDSLLASFEDREARNAADRTVISRLGLRFRGRNAWPQFRSYRPGYAPWHLVGWEVRLITQTLEQATDVCWRVKNGLDLMARESENVLLVRRSDVSGSWADYWEPAPKPPVPSAAPVPQRDHLEMVSLLAPSRAGAWEAALVFLPAAVAERGRRPYYPRTWLCVDQSTGLVSGIDLMEPGTSDTELQEAFLVGLGRAGARPAELRLSQDESARLLQPVADSLGIRIKRERRLPGLEYARQSLFDYLDR